MTIAHLPRLLSIEDWDALPEDNSAHFELQEGLLLVNARPLRRHARAAFRIAKQLDDQLPDGLEALQEFEVTVQEEFPPTVRVPDVIVTRSAGPERRLGGSDVLLAIEVISPGSKRLDTVMKPAEYAEAGIPFYWVIDLEPPVSLAAYHLAGELGYQEAPAATGIFTTSEPVELRIDLTTLTDPR